MKTKQQPLVVTTAHKGVFFGYGEPTDAKTIVLERARMCVYWTDELKGVMGLATTGPKSGCKIGPAVQRITIQDVTAIIEATPEAATNWEKGPWN